MQATISQTRIRQPQEPAPSRRYSWRTVKGQLELVGVRVTKRLWMRELDGGLLHINNTCENKWRRGCRTISVQHSVCASWPVIYQRINTKAWAVPPQQVVPSCPHL